MKPKKTDVMIVMEEAETFQVYIRVPFLFIFKRWIPLTWEKDGKEEAAIFGSLKKAEDFINLITE